MSLLPLSDGFNIEELSFMLDQYNKCVNCAVIKYHTKLDYLNLDAVNF